jgi:hypothetical protein
VDRSARRKLPSEGTKKGLVVKGVLMQ